MMNEEMKSITGKMIRVVDKPNCFSFWIQTHRGAESPSSTVPFYVESPALRQRFRLLRGKLLTLDFKVDYSCGEWSCLVIQAMLSRKPERWADKNGRSHKPLHFELWMPEMKSEEEEWRLVRPYVLANAKKASKVARRAA